MRRTSLFATLLVLCTALTTAHAHALREDVIWARTALEPITLDGVLDEAVWDAAESMYIEFGTDAGIPGSGWKAEAGWDPTDPTRATLKLLVRDNQLYLGAHVPDASVGGSVEFNRFDGFLMAIKDHLDPGHPKPPAEYFYSWWYPETVDPQPTGQSPSFLGRWGEEWPPTGNRTPEQIAAWDAVTVVEGLSNDDASDDGGYTVEMRFDLGVIGYDVTQVDGDVIEWNISIYDTDWFWPIDPLRFSSGRVWWQGPWGNVAQYNEVRVHARPDVTTASGRVPTIAPEMVIANLNADPSIDGVLDEAVWGDAEVYTIDIRWSDDELRETYDGVGPYSSGQYQPPVNGGEAFVLDPADATVRMYHHGDMLYMGFEVRDLVVQYAADFNRWDGFLINLNDRLERDLDQQLLGRRLAFQVGQDGTAVPQEFLASLVASEDATIALTLTGTTTVDTLGLDIDEGYTAELAVDLTALGYPPGLGDRTLFLGLNLLDGDSFTPFTDSYGTRTWWYREYEGTCCAAWMHLSPIGTPVDDGTAAGDEAVVLHRVDPAQSPTVVYWLPARSRVTFEVFDLRGRLVERRPLGTQGRGERRIPLFQDAERGAGMYLYRLRLEDPADGRVLQTLQGKAILVK